MKFKNVWIIISSCFKLSQIFPYEFGCCQIVVVCRCTFVPVYKFSLVSKREVNTARNMVPRSRFQILIPEPLLPWMNAWKYNSVLLNFTSLTNTQYSPRFLHLRVTLLLSNVCLVQNPCHMLAFQCWTWNWFVECENVNTGVQFGVTGVLLIGLLNIDKHKRLNRLQMMFLK